MFLLCTDQKGPKQDRQLEGLIELEEVSLMLPCGKKLPVLHCNKIFQAYWGKNPQLIQKKFTFSTSHFSQNSHFQCLIFSQNSQFQSLIFHKIHIFKVSFFTKFTFFKYQMLGNLWIQLWFLPQCECVFNAKNICINAKCLVFCVPFFVGILHAILPHFTPFYPSLFCQLALPFFHTFASESFILESSRVFFLEFRNLIIFSCFTFRRGRWESSFNSCQPSHGEDWVFGPKPIRIDSNS